MLSRLLTLALDDYSSDIQMIGVRICRYWRNRHLASRLLHVLEHSRDEELSVATARTLNSYSFCPECQAAADAFFARYRDELRRRYYLLMDFVRRGEHGFVCRVICLGPRRRDDIRFGKIEGFLCDGGRNEKADISPAEDDDHTLLYSVESSLPLRRGAESHYDSARRNEVIGIIKTPEGLEQEDYLFVAPDPDGVVFEIRVRATITGRDYADFPDAEAYLSYCYRQHSRPELSWSPTVPDTKIMPIEFGVGDIVIFDRLNGALAPGFFRIDGFSGGEARGALRFVSKKPVSIPTEAMRNVEWQIYDDEGTRKTVEKQKTVLLILDTV